MGENPQKLFDCNGFEGTITTITITIMIIQINQVHCARMGPGNKNVSAHHHKPCKRGGRPIQVSLKINLDNFVYFLESFAKKVKLLEKSQAFQKR